MYATETAFKQGMGAFATGVTVLTVDDGHGRAIGITANSLASVSLRPPLLSFCIDHKAERYPYFLNAKRFGISILNRDQKAISSLFAKPLANSVDFSFAFFEGLPVIPDAHGHIVGQIEARLTQGDHDIFIVAVTNVRVNVTVMPLLYHQGHYGEFLAAS